MLKDMSKVYPSKQIRSMLEFLLLIQNKKKLDGYFSLDHCGCREGVLLTDVVRVYWRGEYQNNKFFYISVVVTSESGFFDICNPKNIVLKKI